MNGNIVYLSGVRSPWLDQRANLALLSETGHEEMPIGLLVQPGTKSMLIEREPAPTRRLYRVVGIDNGRFTAPGRAIYTDDGYLALIEQVLEIWGSNYVLFATAADEPRNWEETLRLAERGLPMLRRAGVPAAIVLQDGATVATVPWSDCDAVFIGGSDEWRAGPEVREIIHEANRRRLWAHMGRVNSAKRLQIAETMGCNSGDGTFLKHAGGDAGVDEVAGWVQPVETENWKQLSQQLGRELAHVTGTPECWHPGGGHLDRDGIHIDTHFHSFPRPAWAPDPKKRRWAKTYKPEAFAWHSGGGHWDAGCAHVPQMFIGRTENPLTDTSFVAHKRASSYMDFATVKQLARRAEQHLGLNLSGRLYGCGTYGCVAEVEGDPSLVVKITSDPRERLWAQTLYDSATRGFPIPGMVQVYSSLDDLNTLDQRHRMWAYLRDEAGDISDDGFSFRTPADMAALVARTDSSPEFAGISEGLREFRKMGMVVTDWDVENNLGRDSSGRIVIRDAQAERRQ